MMTSTTVISTGKRLFWLLTSAAFVLIFMAIGLNTTGTNALAPTPVETQTRTPKVYAMISPTLSKAGASLATLRVLNGTALNVPTWTPGPSMINLDGKPHLIDFNADWCAPCISMKPSLRKLKQKYGDQITFWDINTDNPSSDKLTRKYRAQVLPTIIFLDANGEKVLTLLGYQDEAQMEAAIKQVLGID